MAEPIGVVFVAAREDTRIHTTEDTYDILASNDDYIVYLRSGRSVYKSSASGSQYEPTRLIFAKIIEVMDALPLKGSATSQRIRIMPLLESPIRRA